MNIYERVRSVNKLFKSVVVDLVAVVARGSNNDPALFSKDLEHIPHTHICCYKIN